METFLSILFFIIALGIGYLIKAVAAMIATTTLSWKNAKWKNAFSYSLYIIGIAAAGLLLSWLSLTFFSYVFFLIVIGWIYANIWAFGRVYGKGFWESIGGMIFAKVMEIGFFFLLLAIFLSLLASFSPEVANELPRTGNLNNQMLQNFDAEDFDPNSLEGINEEAFMELLENMPQQ